MFKKILVANRGEIAVRIIRACKELNIPTVAIHSDVDEESMHVRLAEESICVGSHKPQNSYLNVGAIMSAADLTGADAIHPGYGFLSENYHFAEIVTKSKIKFIGPSAEIMKKMGDKIEAKRTAKKLGLPIIEGSEGTIKSLEEAKNISSKIGYPILISLTYLFLNKILKKFSLRNERVLGFFIFLVIFYFLSHYKNVNSLIVGFSNNFFSDTKVEDETFWKLPQRALIPKRIPGDE